MKKLLLTTALCCCAWLTQAQNPELFEHSWYLTEMTVDLGESTYVNQVEPGIQPDLIIESDLEFYGNMACNGFMGQFTYDGDDTFLVDEFMTTLIECMYQDHVQFELEFSSYFQDDDIWYILYEANDIVYLELHAYPGYALLYQNTVLSTEQFQLNQIALAPNPTKDIVYLNGIDQLEGSYSVHDLTGQLIAQGDLQRSIDLSAHQTGVYFITVQIGAAQRVIKVVRQ